MKVPLPLLLPSGFDPLVVGKTRSQQVNSGFWEETASSLLHLRGIGTIVWWERQSADQADFVCLLGVDFADPDHAAAHGVERFLAEDEFDRLAMSLVESPPQPETSFGGI
jgi:hypothetical protein